METLYPYPNTKKCYWHCMECLKGYDHKCSQKCPGYLSTARVKRIRKEREEREWSLARM
jgi:hypothetical protein